MITKKQLCKELNVSLSTVDRHISMGMPHHKIGKNIRFVLEEVLEWYKTAPISTK